MLNKLISEINHSFLCSPQPFKFFTAIQKAQVIAHCKVQAMDQVLVGLT